MEYELCTTCSLDLIKASVAYKQSLGVCNPGVLRLSNASCGNNSACLLELWEDQMGHQKARPADYVMGWTE